MKKTRLKNLLRNVRGSLNRFLSILFIVALGSGFMAGLAATSPDMYATADRYFDENDYFDLRLTSVVGFTDEDVEVVRALPGIRHMDATRVKDLLLMAGDGESYTSRVYGVLDETGTWAINRFVLKEGRLPTGPGRVRCTDLLRTLLRRAHRAR